MAEKQTVTSYVFLSASFPRGHAKGADPCSSRIWAFSKIITAGPLTSRFENETNRISPKAHQYYGQRACAYYGQRGPKLKPKNLKKKKLKSKVLFGEDGSL